MAAVVGTLVIAVGVAVTMLTVGLRAEFSHGIYSNQVDHLARSFSISKAQPHGVRATGVESLRDSDVQALRANLDPSVVEHVIPITQGRAVLRRGPHGYSGGVIGGSEDYLSYLHTPLLRGSMFTSDHVNRRARVILIGPGVVKALFPEDPEAALGSQVRVGRLTFTVIGLVGKDVTGGNSSVTLAPVTTVRGDLLGGKRTIGTIGVVARSAATLPSASRQATEILEHQRGVLKAGVQNDFSVTTFSADRLALARPLIVGVFWFAVGVAALCLLVGAVTIAGLRRDRADLVSTRSRPSAAHLVGRSLLEASVGTCAGILAGGLGGHFALSALADYIPQVGAPELVTPVTLAAGLGFGLAVAVCGAAPALIQRGRAVRLSGSSSPRSARTRSAMAQGALPTDR